MNVLLTAARARLVHYIVPALAWLCLSSASSAAVFVSVNVAPPALPVYAQPVAPAPGYIWTPGYWAWGPDGYYWVPGTWVLAPYVGALWTPGYWGWSGAAYVWHPGYWGPRVGYYGGINYGFGYFGVGYAGGYWNRGVFSYNTAVTNVNVTNVYNTYNRPVEKNISRVSYNGGAGGIVAQPNSEERLAERDAHREATPMQLKHEQLASSNRALLASVNHGSPTLAATPRPAAFKQANVGAPKVEGGAGNPEHVAAHPNQGMPPQGHAQRMAPPPGQPHGGEQPHHGQGHGGDKNHEEGHGR